ARDKAEAGARAASGTRRRAPREAERTTFSRSSPLLPYRKCQHARRDRRVEAVGTARHGDFHEEVALGFVIRWQPLLLIANEQEARLAVFRFEIVLLSFKAR